MQQPGGPGQLLEAGALPQVLLAWFEASSEATLIADERGGLVYANPAALRRSAGTRNDFLSQSLQDIDPSLAATWSRLEDPRWHSGVVTDWQSWHDGPDGRRVAADSRVQALRVGDRRYLVQTSGDLGLRRDAERELRRTLAFVQGIIDAFPDFLFEGNAEGRYLNAWTRNPELLAASREFMLGRTLDEVLSPESAAIAKAAFREANEAGVSLGKVISIDTALGRHWYELSVSRMPMGDGEPPHFITVSRDVTARLVLQQALESKERQFRSLVENSPDLIARFDASMHCLYANPALAQRTAHRVAALTDATPDQIFGAEAGGQLRQHLEAAFRGKPPQQFELAWSDGEGRTACMLVRLTPESEGGPDVASTLLIGRDITELRSYQHRIHRLVESNIIGVVFWRSQGLVEDANDAFLSMLGYARQDLADGRIRWDRLAPQGHEGMHAQGFEAIRRHSAGGAFETALLHRSGRQVPVLVGAAFLDGGRDLGVAYVLDLTERQRAEMDRRAREAAEAASSAKGEFLASMSHEIRTPMNAILGMSYLALQGPLDHQQRRYIQTVHRSAESLLGVINDILDFSKIEAGRLDIEHIDFDLADVMDSLAGVLGMKAEEKGLELVFDQSPQIPTRLVGDPSRLSQVLLNLGGNAVKFTERGEVIVAIRLLERDATSAHLRFEVRDSGIGIDAQVRQRLFQPFAQGDASTSRRYGGTGLGLAICRRLVELMGGQIGVDSEPGRGSLFHFTLRLDVPPQAVVPADHIGLHGARVLVIDDNPSARQVLVGMARALGLRSESARDASQALALLVQADLEDAPFDLALVDWKMPHRDGVDCLEAIAGASFRCRPPAVLMVTGFGVDDLKSRLTTRGLRYGAILAKPVSPSALIDACAQALGGQVDRSPGPARDQALLAHQSRLRGARVLVVEDNAVNQELARELLVRSGMAVTVVDNGAQAVDRLARESFDAVLMDCEMPVMDGYTAATQLRRHVQLQDLPIIAMTANTMAGDRERALAAGMNDQIGKPVRVDEMFATLARWIRPRDAGDGQAATPAIEGLPGIDLSQARDRGLQDPVLHGRLLRLFLDELAGAGSALQTALSSGDEATLRRLAHNLTSMAGTLGAHGVERAAARLERACLEGPPVSGLQPLVDDVLAEVQPVLEGLRQWCAAAAEAEAEASKAP